MMPGTSRRIASASSIFNVPAPPQPVRMPLDVVLPEKIRITFCPRLAICASTWALAPLPIPTIAMTAATPMMMPSAVSTERILFRRNARNAMLNVDPTLIALFRDATRPLLKLVHRIQPSLNCNIVEHQAIAHDYVASRVGCNVRLVREHNDGVRA